MMNKKHPETRLLFLYLIALSLFFSCGPSIVGYGVILWSSKQQELPNSQLVTIILESKIRKEYTVKNEEDGKIHEIERWRLRFFEDKEEAIAFQKEFQEYKDNFALCQKDKLPVREKPQARATKVYKLAENEVVKVLRRGKEEKQIGTYSGYWYEILTKEGVSGYSFDAYLRTFQSDEKKDVLSEESNKPGAYLKRLIDENWYPEDFEFMINAKQIDLYQFSPKFGFKLDMENKSANLDLIQYKLNFPFTEIKQLSPTQFEFKGSSLTAQFVGSKRLKLRFWLRGYRRSEILIPMQIDFDQKIKEERQRRWERFNKFISHSGNYSSSECGTLRINNDKSFSWTACPQLAPPLLPEGNWSSGRVEFSVFPDGSLPNRYEDAIVFRFYNGSSSRRVVFLYHFVGNKLFLEWTPESNIRYNRIAAISGSPKVFTFQF